MPLAMATSMAKTATRGTASLTRAAERARDVAWKICWKTTTRCRPNSENSIAVSHANRPGSPVEASTAGTTPGIGPIRALARTPICRSMKELLIRVLRGASSLRTSTSSSHMHPQGTFSLPQDFSFPRTHAQWEVKSRSAHWTRPSRHKKRSRTKAATARSPNMDGGWWRRND